MTGLRSFPKRPQTPEYQRIRFPSREGEGAWANGGTKTDLALGKVKRKVAARVVRAATAES